MISPGYRWPLYDTSPTLTPLRRIDSEIIRFGRTNHQPDNAVCLPFMGSDPGAWSAQCGVIICGAAPERGSADAS
jgi:hypothetical protein